MPPVRRVIAPGVVQVTDIDGPLRRRSDGRQVDVAHLTVRELLKDSLERRGADEVYDDDHTLVRAASSHVEGFNDLLEVFQVAITAGFDAGGDTTAGWVRNVSLPNFLPSQVAYVDTPAKLQLVERGGTAAHVGFGFAEKTGWRLARYGAQFSIGEEDLVDGAPLSVWQNALGEVGAAARRLIPDLVYATVLSNADLADGSPLFDASRGNLASGGGSALGETSIDAGIAAIGGQVLMADEDTPAHLNLAPRYLIVPPADVGPARRHVRNMAIGDGNDLLVRGESRLTTVGVVDPRDDELVQGNGANWLLAASEAQAPGIQVGYLNGRTTPVVRTFTLAHGEWGMGFDIKFDVGVCAVDGRGLYFAVGQ